MTRRYTRPFAVAAAALLVFVAFAAAGCKPSVSTTAIAVVNGTEIPKSALDAQIAQMKKASPASFEGTTGVEVEKQYRAQILNSLIQLELIKEAAKTLNVSVTSKQVDDYVSQLQTQYGGKPALDTAMKSAGFTLASLREQITNNLLAEAVGNKVVPTGTVTVTDAQIKTYYNQNKSSYATPAQIHAEHILIATTDTPLAKSLFSQVQSGGDFAALAKKYSTDPGSKNSGGDLGWAAPTSYVAPFASAVTKMKINEYRLVQTQYGWHVIKLLGRRAAAQQSLAAATPAIRSTLEQSAKSDAFSTYLDGLQKKATIQILDATLKTIIDANTKAAASSSTATSTGK